MPVLQSSVNWVLEQAKTRLGLAYDYGQCYSPTDLRQGADCSGVGGWALQALVNGPANIPVGGNGQWAHAVSTESWFYDYQNSRPATPGSIGPFGTVAVARLQDIPADAALTINIEHGGGGEDSHMNVVVPLPGTPPWIGTIVESNGSYGSCTNNTGAYPSVASLWTDHWFLPGPWVFDVPPGEPALPANSGTTYTVQSGDDLSTIAADLNVTLAALETANPGINFNLIYPGQVINVP